MECNRPSVPLLPRLGVPVFEHKLGQIPAQRSLDMFRGRSPTNWVGIGQDAVEVPKFVEIDRSQQRWLKVRRTWMQTARTWPKSAKLAQMLENDGQQLSNKWPTIAGRAPDRLVEGAKNKMTQKYFLLALLQPTMPEPLDRSVAAHR